MQRKIVWSARVTASLLATATLTFLGPPSSAQSTSCEQATEAIIVALKEGRITEGVHQLEASQLDCEGSSASTIGRRALWGGNAYRILNDFAKGEAQLKKGLSALGRLESRDWLIEGQVHNVLGNIYLKLKRYKKAEGSLQSALATFGRMERRNWLQEAQTHSGLGDLYIRTNRYEASERSLQSALTAFGRLENRVWLYEGAARLALGNLYFEMKRYKMSEDYLRAAQAAFDHLKPQIWFEAKVQLAFGDLYRLTHRYEASERSLQSALAAFGRMERRNWLQEGHAHRSLGDLYLRTNRYEASERSLQSALAAFGRMERRNWLQEGQAHLAFGRMERRNWLQEGHAHRSLGDLYLRTNRYEASERSLQSALAAFGRMERRNWLQEGQAHLTLGNLYLQTNRYAASERSLESAQLAFARLERKSLLWEGQVHALLGDLYRLTNRNEASERSLQFALAACSRLERREWVLEGFVYMSLGDLYIQTNRYTASERSLQSALTAFGRLEQRDWLQEGQVHSVLGFLYIRANRYAASERSLQSALTAFGHLDPRDWLQESQVHRFLGALYLVTNRYEASERSLQSALTAFGRLEQRYWLQEGQVHRLLGGLHRTKGRSTDASRHFALARKQIGRTHPLEAAEVDLRSAMTPDDRVRALGRMLLLLDRVEDTERSLQAQNTLHPYIIAQVADQYASNAPEAWHWSDVGRAVWTMQAMRRGSGGRLGERFASTGSDVKTLQARMSNVEAAIDPKPDLRTRESLFESPEALLDEAQALVTALRALGPAGEALAEATYLVPLAASDIPLEDGEVLVEYRVLEDKVLLFVLRKGEAVTAHSLGKLVVHPGGGGLEPLEQASTSTQSASAALAAVVAAYGAEANCTGGARPRALSLELGAALYDRLVGPAKLDPTRDKRIIVVADGALWRLPFEALLTTAPAKVCAQLGGYTEACELVATSSKCNLQSIPFVDATYGVSYLPSARALRWQRKTLRQVPRDDVDPKARPLLFADAVFGSDDPRCKNGLSCPSGEQVKRFDERLEQVEQGASPDASSAVALASRGSTRRSAEGGRLLGTAYEAAALNGLLGRMGLDPVVHEGLDAQEEYLGGSDVPVAPGFVLGLPMHGVVNAYAETGVLVMSIPTSTAADGLLYPYETSNLDLRGTEVVLLTACQLGRGLLRPGQGVLGMVDHFMAQGAKRVWASGWDIDDASGAELTARMMAYAVSGEEITSAAAHARGDLRRQYGVAGVHPWYWAGLRVIGAPGQVQVPQGTKRLSTEEALGVALKALTKTPTTMAATVSSSLRPAGGGPDANQTVLWLLALATFVGVVLAFAFVRTRRSP